MNIRRLLSMLCVLLLCMPCALAQGSFMTAEGVSGGIAFSADAHAAPEGFCLTLQWGDTRYELKARAQEDGRLLLALANGMAALLPALPDEEGIGGILEPLENAAAFESAQYSSLFTLGQSVALGSHAVSAALLSVLEGWPALDEDGALRAALESALASPEEEWAALTRYMADQRQYPGTYLWQLNVYAPCLPAIYGTLRTDEYGQDVTIAVKNGVVSDWDETIHALEEGTETDGFLLSGFIMTYDEPAEKNVYAELTVRAGAVRCTVELDHYAQHDGSGSWNAYLIVRDEQDTVLVDATLTGMPEEGYALPDVAAETILDAAQSSEWIGMLGL